MFEISDLLLRKLRTTLLYLSMICLGMCTAIPGPTLLDLARSIQTEASKVSTIYIGRSVGYLLGSFLGGVLLDHLKKPQLLLFLFNLTMSICTIIIPYSPSLQVLIGIMAFSGSAMGALDTGLNVWCLDLWDDESSPYFQALHFFFGLGAFFAPIIAGPFLSQDNESNYNYTSFNTTENNKTLSDKDNVFVISEMPSIDYIYGIIGAISLFVSVLFFLLFFTSVKVNSSQNKLLYKDPKEYFRIMILFVAFLLLSVYAGTEIGFGQMIAIYAVKSNHKFTESLASYITSLYWGTFTFSRGLSIVLSLKFSPFVIIVFDGFLMCLAAILCEVGNVYKPCLWLGSAVLGLGLASFYPSTITWVERHVNVNNKIGSYFVVAASLGEMIAPLTISQYVDEVPEFLFHVVVICVGICIILISFLRVITSHVGIKQPIQSNISKCEMCSLTSGNQNEDIEIDA